MILVLGLSPARQRILCFEQLKPGKVNRALRATEIDSGKCVNVARVARQLGARVQLITTRKPWRLCQTLLAEGSATELVEEAPGIPNAAEFIRRFDRQVRRAKLVVLSGSVPPGCGDDFYTRLIRRSPVPVLLDVHGRQLYKARPFLLKINSEEYSSRCGAEWLVITKGASAVEVRHGKEKFEMLPPRVKAVNPIGSGDAMLAGIAVGLSRNTSMEEAIRFGIACGAANALTPLPGFVNAADVQRLCSQVSSNRRVKCSTPEMAF